MGMIKERIRTEEQNQRHRALVAENRRLKLRKYQEQEENRSVNIFENQLKETILQLIETCFLSI